MSKHRFLYKNQDLELLWDMKKHEQAAIFPNGGSIYYII